LRFSAWDDEDFGVVYNKTTGQTHLIGVLGVSILARLSEVSCSTVSEIATSLNIDPSSLSSSLSAPLISSTLRDLERLELVFSS